MRILRHRSFIKDNVAGAAQWAAIVAANECVVNENASRMGLKDHPMGHVKNKLLQDQV